jgi:hypothetical protein
MKYPSTPAGKDGKETGRARPRGAIRTHLGRKRVGARGRGLRDETFQRIQEVGSGDRARQEDLFDRLAAQAQALFEQAGELTVAAFDKAVDTACDGLVTAGEFTAENAERLRHYVRRDLLQRTDPSITFRTGEITSPGTLTCAGCGWKVRLTRTTVLPPCPQCTETSFRKEA